MRCKYVIIKNHEHHDHEEINLNKTDAYEYIQNAMSAIKGYKNYLKKHGHHFTNELAKHASEMMVNANGLQHSWTSDQVKIKMLNAGLNIPDHITLGDITYLANMYYADFYPDPLTDEMQCIHAAYKIATDPDGYEGMILRRWISDIVGKKIQIDWEHFI